MEQYTVVAIPPPNTLEYLEHLAEAIRLRYKVEMTEKPYKVTLINPFHCGEHQMW